MVGNAIRYAMLYSAGYQRLFKMDGAEREKFLKMYRTVRRDFLLSEFGQEDHQSYKVNRVFRARNLKDYLSSTYGDEMPKEVSDWTDDVR